MPIVAVTGTSGKTTTARMIAHVMRAAGRRVGLTTSDGAYVDGTLVASGDMTGPRSAREILADPRVDFAVLETARGGIRRAGLAFDRCDVGVVTNVASDHLGLKGVETLADLARVGARVPAAIAPSGANVLNADSPWTAAMAREAGGEVILFCIADDNKSRCGRHRCFGRRTPRQP
ncbi:MAG: Mur ligase family protein [Chloroflexota bacterium]|nr:Mur ligase family protein [Chloroflexota bacterium]